MKLASKSVCALMLTAAFFAGPASAVEKGATPKPPPPPVATSGIKGESADDKHKGTIEIMEVRKAGEHPLIEHSASSTKNLKGH
jgi:hypothetical protein